MATFNEFRDSFPESNNEKGERFEIFLCDWFLKHHPVYKNKFKKIWRFTEWPNRWSGIDIGTDLIAQDSEGKICAIQAKFYKGQSSIPKGDVDSFLADSARDIIDYRLLIATTDRIGINATNAIEGQAIPVQLFLLNDFINSPIEWPASLEALSEGKRRDPHEARPHQQEAIEAVCSKLDGRGQLLMACGTGKTLTGQRIAEQLDVQRTLVLLPSLLLLSKTVVDWLTETKTDFSFLPVCSDVTVTKKVEDEIRLSSSELGVKPTTDEDEIADFLRSEGRKVIFSTYQSSPKIAEAFKKHELKPFDLIIADEAHRCAGKVAADYSTVLDTESLPAQRRLFMTATPRTYKSHLKKRAEDKGFEVASMDDESVFGPVLHHLTFGQAIANDPPLLTDYQVVVVGVNEALVKQMVDERVLVELKGVETDAKTLAIQVGLAKAIREYDLTRVISFHSRVKLAKNFAAGFTEILGAIPEDKKPGGQITYSHVSGAMPTSQRTQGLQALASLDSEDRYIMGNARCLSEGVDVPALDGVAFVDPRRSEIDIVQAVGRAIRRSSDKSVGTIIIPVFIEEGDDPEQVISSSQFDQVWKVVNALRAHDEALGEEIDALRRELGRQQQIAIKGSKIVFDLPEAVGDDFLNALECRLVETCSSSWEEYIALLMDYKLEHGSCLIPAKHIYRERNLGSWADAQRTLYKKEKLTADKISRLNALDFIWDPLELFWEQNFNALKSYKAEHGDCLVPFKFEFGGVRLGQWVNSQRQSFKEGELSAIRVQRLTELGFIWDQLAYVWNNNFELLKAYKAENGDCLVAEDCKFRGEALGEWVKRQRMAYRSGTLSPDREADLEALGFIWDPAAVLWGRSIEALRQYKAHHGDCLVPRGFSFDGFNLGNWVSSVRIRARKKKLTKEQIDELNSLDFIWDPDAYVWNRFLDALQQYQALHGDCLVPQTEVFAGLKLGGWLSGQRQSRAKGKLPEDKIQKLEALGVEWTPKDDRWEKNLRALQEYKAIHGDSFVTQTCVFQNLRLGTWATKQRQDRIKSKLSEDKIRRLDELGFDWDPVNSIFEKGFDALKQYKETYGDCLVPDTYTINGLKLGSWVRTKRGAKKRGALSAEVVARLNAIGLVWDPSTSEWDSHFSAIKQYQADHGDCLVPRDFVVNGLNLGKVVRNLRNQYARKALSSQQVTDLNSIGFVWLVEPYIWDRFVDALRQYKAEKGDCLVPQGYILNDLKLGTWVNAQRQNRSKGTLSEARRNALEGLGFIWSPYEYKWKKSFDALAKFKAENGHCLVPACFVLDNIELGFWVTRQRTFRRQGRLTDDQITRLDTLGFVWEPRLKKVSSRK